MADKREKRNHDMLADSLARLDDSQHRVENLTQETPKVAEDKPKAEKDEGFKRITLFVKEDIYDRVSAAAMMTGKSKNRVILDLVEDILQTPEYDEYLKIYKNTPAYKAKK